MSSDETAAPAAQEPESLPDLNALFIEAQRKAAEDKVQREREEAEHQVAFLERLDRMVGARAWKPGDATGVRCPACRRSYVFDERMRQVHPGICPGHPVRDGPTRNGAYGDDD